MTETTTMERELMPPDRTQEDPRGDGWFVTRSGNKFFPLSPRIEEIHIGDISFALSNTSRFGGHVEFYSVAEHSCIVCDNLPVGFQLLGLLHDATEAYLGDMVRPLKQQMPEYKEAEKMLWVAISAKFGLPVVMPDKIKEIDNRCLLAERNQLMPEGPNTRHWYWDTYLEPLECKIHNWSPQIARREFMNRYNLLTK